MSAAGETWRKPRTEEIWPEMKKKQPEMRVVMCYPEHYGNQGMWWATQRIDPAEEDGFMASHPGAVRVGTETYI